MRVRRCWLVLLALFAVSLAILVPLVLRPLPRYAKQLTLRERLRMHTWVVLRGFSHWIVRSPNRLALELVLVLLLRTRLALLRLLLLLSLNGHLPTY